MRRIPLLCVLLSAIACDQAAPVPDAPADSAAQAPGTPIDPAAGARDVAVVPATDPVIVAWLARVDSTVFTRWGACPFECCVYRDWVAEAPVIVRAQPDSTAPVVTTIPAGARFAADSGFVRITSAQLVVVLDSVEAWRVTGRGGMGERDTLAPGDTLLVLDYEGEGFFHLTDGSSVFSAGQFWVDADDGGSPHPDARGRTIGSRGAEWWAQVRAPDGSAGWIDVYASRLGNLDACG